jgi:hypothetical protein
MAPMCASIEFVCFLTPYPHITNVMRTKANFEHFIRTSSCISRKHKDYQQLVVKIQATNSCFLHISWSQDNSLTQQKSFSQNLLASRSCVDNTDLTHGVVADTSIGLNTWTLNCDIFYSHGTEWRNETSGARAYQAAAVVLEVTNE